MQDYIRIDKEPFRSYEQNHHLHKAISIENTDEAFASGDEITLLFILRSLISERNPLFQNYPFVRMFLKNEQPSIESMLSTNFEEMKISGILAKIINELINQRNFTRLNSIINEEDIEQSGYIFIQIISFSNIKSIRNKGIAEKFVSFLASPYSFWILAKEIYTNIFVLKFLCENYPIKLRNYIIARGFLYILENKHKIFNRDIFKILVDFGLDVKGDGGAIIEVYFCNSCSFTNYEVELIYFLLANGAQIKKLFPFDILVGDKNSSTPKIISVEGIMRNLTSRGVDVFPRDKNLFFFAPCYAGVVLEAFKSNKNIEILNKEETSISYKYKYSI